METRARTFGVTLPTSTKPNPIIMNCLAASPCLSHPAARPRGLLNSRPKTAGHAHGCGVTCHSRAMVGSRLLLLLLLLLLLQQQQQQPISGFSSGSEHGRQWLHSSRARRAHLSLRAARDPCNCRRGPGRFGPPVERSTQQRSWSGCMAISNSGPRGRMPQSSTRTRGERSAHLTQIERLCESSGSYIFTNG